MHPAIRRISPLFIALAAALSGSLYAAPAKANGSSTKIYRPSPRYKLSPADLAAENARRRQIGERAQSVFSLMTAEMALGNGDAGSALALYIRTLRDTKNPDVAERAMEIAIDAEAYPIAEAIYQEWRKMEPVPGPAQQRMAWVRALSIGDTATVLSNLDGVLAGAGETQRKRAFLQLSQGSLKYPELLKQGAQTVHKAALQYPDLPEAAVADVFYSTDNEHDTIAALQRLAQHDADIRPATRLTLQVVAQTRPQVLTRFFAKTDSDKLSPTWQELEIESLMYNGDYKAAMRKAERLLAKEPRAEIYFQAARIAAKQNPDNVAAAANYYEKAYQTGTAVQKDQAAVSLALLNATRKDYAAAESWAQKISQPAQAFDKAALQASLAAEQKQWQKAYTLAKQARELPLGANSLFSRAELNNVYYYALSESQTPAQALREMNEAAAKIEQAKAAAGYAEDLSALLYQRGLLYADKLGQPEKAVADFRRYLIHNPGNAEGENALGYTMLSLGKEHLPEAMRHIQSAYAKEPENIQIADSMGWAYYLNGQPEKAVPLLEKAYAKDGNAEIGAHLGAAYWKQGNQEAARKVWRESRSKDPANAALAKILQENGVALP